MGIVSMEKIKSKISIIFLMIAIGLVLFIDNLDMSAVNLILTEIGKDYSVRTNKLQWVITGYFISSCSFFLISGRVKDSFGVRNTLSLGVIIIFLSSLTIVLSNSFEILILGRVFQGIGYAFTFPMLLLALKEIVPQNKINIAMGCFVSIAAISSMIGPSFGGFLSALFGWRSIFIINLFVGLIALTIFWTQLDSRKSNKTTLCKTSMAASVVLFLIVFALTFVLNSFSEMKDIVGFFNNFELIYLLHGTIFLSLIAQLCFIFYKLNENSSPPILIRKNLISSDFIKVNILRCLIHFVSFSLFFSFPLFLQFGKGISILETSLYFTILTSAVAVFSFLAGKANVYVKDYLLIAVGLTLLLSGSIVLVLAFPIYSNNLLYAFLSLLGAGFGIMYTMVNVLLMKNLSDEYSGMMTGFFYTLSFFAGIVGVSVSNIIFSIYSDSSSALDAMYYLNLVWLALIGAALSLHMYNLLKIVFAPMEVCNEEV